MQWNLEYLSGTWLRYWLNKSSICTTPAMDWVAIDSQRSDLSAVPSKACFFNTSTNYFCCINVWGPGTTHCSQACQSRKSISVVLGGHTWLSFIKTTALNISESEKLRFSILQFFQNCQVSPKNQWLFDFLQCVLWTMGYVSEKLGVWCFLRTAIRSLKNRGDIRKWLVCRFLYPPTNDLHTPRCPWRLHIF